MVARRALFATFALVTLALASCTPSQLQSTLKQAASDASIIATGLKNALPQLAAIQGMPAGTIAKAGVLVSDIQSVAAAINASTSASAALPSVQQLEADVNTLVSTLASFPLPPPVSTILQATSVLLPVIEIAVGLAVTPHAGTMTPDEARAVLLGY